MARTFTRTEFYDLVWSKPINHLAKEFSLSDVAIHKICRKHEVPTPPRGWWAKKAAGKAVPQTRLKSASKGVSDTIVIVAAELRGETYAVASARELARVRASDDNDDSAHKTPHPIIDHTIAELKRAEPGRNGLALAEAGDCIHCEVAPASIDRLHKILLNVVAAASRQGFSLEAGSRRAQFRGDGETLSVSVTEVFQRIKHKPTDEELAQQDAWRKRSNQMRSWHRSDDAFPYTPDWDYICTGRLGFEMEGVYVPSGSGPRKTFRDGKTQRLEEMSSDIAVALAVMAVAKRDARERREADERKRLNERRERERPRRLEYIADRRKETLNQILNEVADLDRFRRLIAGLSTLDGEASGARVAEFLEWSRNELLLREATFSRESLENRFAADQIFGDDDDHSFKSQYWY